MLFNPIFKLINKFLVSVLIVAVGSIPLIFVIIASENKKVHPSPNASLHLSEPIQ